MTIRRFQTPLPFAADVVRAWHERPGALRRLVPPWEAMEVLEQTGTVREGDRLVMRLWPGVRWEAVHHPLPDGFEDEMVAGPLSSWRHRHRFLDDGAGGCVIHDEVEFFPDLARWLVDSRLGKMFAFRQRRLREELGRHQGKPKLRVLLAGASGLVGTELVAMLQTGGHDVVQLVRRAPKPGQVQWDPARGRLDAKEIEGFDAVISLSGENVGEGAWTDTRKQALIDSRLSVTNLLANTFGQLARPPRVWLSASAVGIYGNRGDDRLTESSAPGSGFLAELCQRWEAAAQTIPGVRVVKLRIGVVLSGHGGALARMVTPFNFGVGGPIGSGRQFFPWIAMDDALYAMLHCLSDEHLSGPVNLVSPEAARQSELAAALGAALGRPAFMPLPAVAVTTLFGEMGKEVLLGGQNVAPAALANRFVWSQPKLADALAWELGRIAPALPVEA